MSTPRRATHRPRRRGRRRRGIIGSVDFQEGDRVAFLRLNPANDEIQIIEAVVVGMVDEYQAVIRFGGGQDITWPVSDLTPLPAKDT